MLNFNVLDQELLMDIDLLACPVVSDAETV